MCGIVGFAAFGGYKGDFDRRKYLQQALFTDTLRGSDGTGVFLARNTKKRRLVMYKKGLAAPDFLQTRLGDALFRETEIRFAIGHNRAKSPNMGDIADETAHPFNIGHITLAHNGALSSWRHREFASGLDVDSEWIATYLANKGLSDLVENMYGSYSLVWYDDKDQSLNFLRNDGRPMAFAITEDENNILYASEHLMLRWIAARNDIKLKDGKVFLTEPGMHFKYTDSAINPAIEKYELAKKVRSFTTTTSYSHSGWKSGQEKYSSKDWEYNDTLPHQRTKNDRKGKKDFYKIIKDLGLTAGQRIPLVCTSYQGHGDVIMDNDILSAAGVAEVLVRRRPEVPDEELYENWSNIFTAEIVGAREVRRDIILYANDLQTTRIPAEVYNRICGGDFADQAELLTTSGLDRYIPYLKGPRDSYITPNNFRKLVQDGCAACSKPITTEDDEYVEFLPDGGVLCPQCATMPDIGTVAEGSDTVH